MIKIKNIELPNREFEIGERIKIKDIILEVVHSPSSSCRNCFFKNFYEEVDNLYCKYVRYCASLNRLDNKDIIFKLVLDVGEKLESKLKAI